MLCVLDADNPSSDPDFCFDVIQNILKGYNEPLLNLHFLSPYAKDYQASIGAYDYIFQLLPLVPDAQVTELLDLLKKELITLKKAIVDNKEDKIDYEPYLNYVLVWSHIFIQMLMTCQFT